MVKNPETGKIKSIKISVEVDCSVTLWNTVFDKYCKLVIVQVFSKINITIGTNTDASRLKDASAWLYINSEGFGLKVTIYKKHYICF